MAARKASQPKLTIATIGHGGQSIGPQYHVAWRPIFCSGFEIGEDGGKLYHHLNNIECTCSAGPHWRALKVIQNCKVDEFAMVGGRGSGKSENSFVIMIIGDAVSKFELYIANRDYRGLVLRENAKDLDDWVSRANDIYGQLGAKLVLSPTIKFVFPSGAEILCDHLQDESAYRKYWGRQFARILIEECPQIASEKTYLNVRLSCRVKEGIGMRAMMIVVGNPDGPGLGWFTKRFVNLRLPPTKEFPGGRPLPSMGLWRNPLSGQTRAYVHSTIYDNPYFLTGRADYLKQLEGIESEQEKRRLLHGDFNALIGQYFSEFRPLGPLPGEPATARHVISREEIKIEPWWPRLISMDIGYKHWSALLKAALSPRGQIIIYDEKVESEVTAEEWGEELARWVKEELTGLPTHTMPLILSHEAFGQRGEGRSLAQMIEQGIRSVLGAGSAVLLNVAKAEGGEDDFFSTLSERYSGPRIVIRQHFNRKRVPGWQFIRTLMRFRSRSVRPIEEMDREHARKLMESQGGDALMEYFSQFEPNPDEVLPKLQITDNCKYLIGALQTLVYDTGGKNPEDIKKTETMEDDLADTFNYICSGYRRYQERLPKTVFMDRQRDKAKADGITEEQMYWHMISAENRFEEQDMQIRPFSYAMGSSRQRQVRYSQ